MSDFRESSKRNWTSNTSVEHINAGSFQRIADSLESLNRSWCGVQEQNVRFRTTIAELERKNQALRRKLTTLKNKLAIAK